MNDLFSWSIPLGRVGTVQVKAHFLLSAFLGLWILDAALAEGFLVGQRIVWLAVFLVALLLHELGHGLAALWLSVDQDEVNLWPLGNFVGPSFSFGTRSREDLIVAAAGPLTSLLLAIITAIGLEFAGAHMIFNPFGNSLGGGSPILTSDGKTLSTAFTPLWYAGWFGFSNWILFVANLIPALPFDNGRFMRGLLESPTRDTLVGSWTARSCAILLGLIGVVLVVKGSHGGSTILMLALLVFMMARYESRMLEDGGYLEETIFGYDFSQGYTSLDASAATVRPRREGALRRWRNRRSEMRRQRRAAKEAAQEHRMDEILDKIHQQGRSSLTEEEKRFLVRVSASYKNRSKSRG